MSNEFFFNSTVRTKGILNSFYSLGESKLLNVIDIYATSENPIHTKEDAFNYNDESLYWVGNGIPNDNDCLSFCFKTHFARVLGFELGTSLNGLILPSKFSFSSSIDNKTWENEVFYSHLYEKGDIFYFTYQSKVSKCFKLTCIKNTISGKSFDVRSLEIFGEVRPYFWRSFGTCQHKSLIKFFPSLLLFILTLYQKDK